MENKSKNLITRPPIVVVLGHIDHGKTTLLDYIRKTKIAEKESGAITQHIGAYEIEYKNKKITFIDTPGHEAFSKIRSHGAKAADIALLIVAADEGVKAQTKEALKHIEETKTPFLVVINKIDKPESNPEKVKRELTDAGVFVEGWGGQIPVAEVSAQTGQGIDELMDLILLMAEMENLQANPDNSAQGIVIESHLDPRRGYTATLIITEGTLEQDDFLIISDQVGKVKILENFLGKPIKKATFSSPVLVVGFEKLPAVGEKFIASKTKTEISASKQEKTTSISQPIILGDDSAITKITLLIKADVWSSIEALKESLRKIALEEKWSFNILSEGVGDISESDVKLADLSKAIIIGFHVKTRPEISLILNTTEIPIVQSETIYEILDKIKEKVFIMISPKKKEKTILGKLKILAIFNPIKGNLLVGGEVLEGKISVNDKIEIWRNETKIGEGKIINLQSQKINVKSVGEKEQCGILVENITDIEKDDILISYFISK